MVTIHKATRSTQSRGGTRPTHNSNRPTPTQTPETSLEVKVFAESKEQPRACVRPIHCQTPLERDIRAQRYRDPADSTPQRADSSLPATSVSYHSGDSISPPQLQLVSPPSLAFASTEAGSPKMPLLSPPAGASPTVLQIPSPVRDVNSMRRTGSNMSNTEILKCLAAPIGYLMDLSRSSSVYPFGNVTRSQTPSKAGSCQLPVNVGCSENGEEYIRFNF